VKSRIVSIILSVVLFSQISFAQLCSVLKDARCGEYHTLAVDDNKNLWACGDGYYAMGLGIVHRIFYPSSAYLMVT
jgi:alpha-tubulin suppressor-like RCC1 family protein